MTCLFCEIVRGERKAYDVYEDDVTLGFLDHRPLFHGHVLAVPKKHVETIADLPDALVGPFFAGIQVLSRAVVGAMEAEGSFVAMNNTVSQSVPHLHVHVVPRRRGDGLRGFFWPRHAYASAEEMQRAQSAVQGAIEEILRARERNR